MKRKSTHRKFNSLWEKQGQFSRSNSHKNLESSFEKRKMDEICLKADLATSSSDYAYVLCTGVKSLLSLGIKAQSIREHEGLFQKILYLGKDLMECTNFKSELFFLGAFIELKILEKWKELKFYNFLLSALKSIRKNISFLSERVKILLEEQIKEYNNHLYQRYFTPIKLTS